MTREDFARIANKAFGKHPECGAGTEEFLSILNRLPGGSGAGGEPTAPGSDPSNGGASLSIGLASVGASHNYAERIANVCRDHAQTQRTGIAKGSA